MGDLTSFSEPAFLPIQIESLCFQISHVIIYLRILLLNMDGLCTLIQYNIKLSITWVQFPQEGQKYEREVLNLESF